MKTHRIGIFTITTILALITGACGTLQIGLEPGSIELIGVPEETEIPAPPPEAGDIETIPTESNPSIDPTKQRVAFEQLGISLEVPLNLYIRKDPEVNFEDSSKLDSYLFYIQNYGIAGGPPSGDFQMYGLLQYRAVPLTWDQFSEIRDNSGGMYQYVNEIEINGLRGFDTQYSGQRNRFVYLFYLDGQVLTIAVSEPTPENKVLADQIISTLELLPGGLSDRSNVVSVVEPNFLYSMLLPDDWTYAFNPTPNINLSEFEASSPDSEVLVEEGAGHSDIYYKSGVSMTMIVFESDSDVGEPYKDRIENQYRVYFNGIEGTEYIFTEPSTAEGKLREVRISYNGKHYLMRFGYASDADSYAIDRIITSLEIPE